MKVLEMLATGTIVICVLSPCSASTTEPLEGTWYEYAYRYGFGFYSYKFLPNDKVVRAEAYGTKGYEREAEYHREGDKINIKFDVKPRYHDKPLLMSGRIGNGVIDFIVSEGSEKWKARVSLAPQCDGNAIPCGSGVFCPDAKDRGARYWKVEKTFGAYVVKDQAAAELSEFVDFLGCAVHLKMRDLYIPHIGFPLQQTLLDPDTRETTSVTEQTFNVESLEKTVKSLSWAYQRTMNLKGERASVYSRGSDRLGQSEMEWHFAKKGGAWYLVAIENAYAQDYGLPWFELKHCSPPALQETKQVDLTQREDFEAFVPQFYCALKQKRKEFYLPRVRFPLPYTTHDQGGASRGVYKQKDQFEGWMISTVDGGEAPLTYNANGNNGKARMESQGAGMSNTWIFKRIDGKWYLVELEYTRY
jgi:hypothetical protein